MLGHNNQYIARVREEVTFRCVHEDDRAALQEGLAGLIAGGDTLRHTCRIFHDGFGEYRWICIEGSRRTGSDGASFCMWSTAT